MDGAYVLVQAKPGQSGRVRRDVESLPNIAEAAETVGRYDVIARAHVRPAEFRCLLDERIRRVAGVIRTHACIAADEFVETASPSGTD